MGCPPNSFPIICRNGKRGCLSVDPRTLHKDKIDAFCNGAISFGVHEDAIEFSPEDEERAYLQEPPTE